MKKPKKSPSAPVPDEELASRMASLALDLKTLDLYAKVPEELAKKQGDLRKLINKCLHQKREAALREALDMAAEEDVAAHRVLRAEVETLSENLIFRREQGADLEVNAFVIPLFVRSAGGLRSEQLFQDEQAFDQLRTSLQEAGLESRKANVVLVAHAYHPEEIARIGYCQLNAMVQEAHDAMTRKQPSAAQAIGDSISGWPEAGFAADDLAVELRFLLGFALKSLDDPFYQVPQKEAAADRYFEARAQRFRQWTEQAAGLVKRCLVTDGREIDIDFLYQDLYFGGTATGLSEQQMLHLMSELQQALDERDLAPAAVHAIVGPNEFDDEVLVRVNLVDADEQVVASAEKPAAAGREVQDELDDVCDALRTIGVESLAIAARFDDDGKPVNTRKWTA